VVLPIGPNDHQVQLMRRSGKRHRDGDRFAARDRAPSLNAPSRSPRMPDLKSI